MAANAHLAGIDVPLRLGVRRPQFRIFVAASQRSQIKVDQSRQGPGAGPTLWGPARAAAPRVPARDLDTSPQPDSIGSGEKEDSYP
jgi:hypothetical protein